MAALSEGDRFLTYAKFKESLADWAISANFSTSLQKSQKDCVVAVCAVKTCSFRIRASFSAREECVIVKVLQDVHNCVGARPLPVATFHGCIKRITGCILWLRYPYAALLETTESRQSWIQRILPETISVGKDTTPKQIIEAIQLKWHKTINYEAAKTAKKIILKDGVESHAQQFELLPSYLAAIKTADPTAHTHLSVDSTTRRFLRLFISPSACRTSFQHCRFFVGMDGTFMKEVFNLTVLLAVALDADNHGVLIAWCLVEGENESSWRYFLANLKTAIPEINQPLTTIMSDRDKGLTAADSEVPLAGRAYCTEHISRNIQVHFGMASREAFNTHLRFAKTQGTYQSGLDKIRAINMRTANYIEKINPELWSSPFLKAKRYGHSTSNVVESVNGHLVAERKLPVLEFLHALWNKTMNTRYEHFKTTNSAYPSGLILTHYSAKLLQLSITQYNATQRTVQFSTPSLATVSTYNGSQYVVNLGLRHCTCGDFQEKDIPCTHAISCIFESGGAPRDYIPYNLTLEAYRATYTQNLPPIDISTLNSTTITPDGKCWAPVTKRKPAGRPPMARKERGGQSSRVQKCSLCKKPGHKAATCQALPISSTPQN